MTPQEHPPAGVFLLGAMASGWILEGLKPDRFDLIGAVLVLAGVFTILWGRTLIS
jgi:drug/metabolite transporter superfamily protein YnfA